MKSPPPELPDEVFILLGRIVTIWNGLESFLNVCIGKLAGFDDIADPKPFILINHSSFPQKLDNFAALCELMKNQYPHLKTYKETVSALKTAQQERNKFIHNSIQVEEESGRLALAKGSARGILKTKIEYIKIEDLKRAEDLIDNAMRSLWLTVLNKDIGSKDERFRKYS
jgi:hypothetical protein